MRQTPKIWIVLCVFLSPSLLAREPQAIGKSDSVGRVKRLKIKNLSDLQRLTPYESISVIQKRYLPKTFRGELNLAFASVINHKYFYLGGLSARLGFFLREDHGLGTEGIYFLPALRKPEAQEITSQGVAPSSYTFPQVYGGLYYKWSPVFGKFAVLNNKIIYFDMYMTFGAGMSRIIDGKSKEDRERLKSGAADPNLAKDYFPTMLLSLGQVFALSKDWAFNWELKWLYTFVQYQSQELYTPVDIDLSFGVNYYFPGAGYR